MTQPTSQPPIPPVGSYTVEGHDHLYAPGERCVRCGVNVHDVDLGHAPKECAQATPSAHEASVQS